MFCGTFLTIRIRIRVKFYSREVCVTPITSPAYPPFYSHLRLRDITHPFAGMAHCSTFPTREAEIEKNFILINLDGSTIRSFLKGYWQADCINSASVESSTCQMPIHWTVARRWIWKQPTILNRKFFSWRSLWWIALYCWGWMPANERK